MLGYNSCLYVNVDLGVRLVSKSVRPSQSFMWSIVVYFNLSTFLIYGFCSKMRTMFYYVCVKCATYRLQSSQNFRRMVRSAPLCLGIEQNAVSQSPIRSASQTLFRSLCED